MKKAVLYLRSSKDRSDVSIDVQRRELMDLARSKGLSVVEEYTDVVESAKSENRPAFQQLITAIQDPKRGWDTVLFLDTSRLSRRRYHAQAFKREAQRKNVDIIYAKMPDMDPITSVIVESVFEAMDEVHSLMSRDKGLAGMAENVRKGFRAGGRAPFGYQIKKISTGVIREGSEVTKSKLEPSSDAPRIKRFLKLRASGRSRTESASQTKLKMAQTSLIGIEWNALTYAGHTVWNVHNPKVSGGYGGKPKRRPRDEWVINRGTHKALITEQEAEAILAQLESASSKRQPKRKHFYLLAGLLHSMEGDIYHGDGGKYYAYKSGTSKVRLNKEEIERAVVKQYAHDLQSDKFVDRMLESAQQQAKQGEADQTPLLRKRLSALTSKISRLIEMGLEMDDREPVMRQIASVEAERKTVAEELAIEESRASSAKMLRAVTRIDVERMLKDVASILLEQDPQNLRALLQQKIERIDADLSSNRIKIHYAIGVKMASPRVSESNPTIRLIKSLKLRA